MTGRIIYSPRAEQHLHDLDEWISQAAGAEIAQRFIKGVLAHIDDILLFPLAGRPRDNIRPGLRTTTYKKRTLIAYFVVEADGNNVVNVVGILHGGQDWEAALRDDDEDESAG